MNEPTYTFSEMTGHILRGDIDTLPILQELLFDECDRYREIEVWAMFDLLKLQYGLVSGRLMKDLLNSILK